MEKKNIFLRIWSIMAFFGLLAPIICSSHSTKVHILLSESAAISSDGLQAFLRDTFGPGNSPFTFNPKLSGNIFNGLPLSPVNWIEVGSHYEDDFPRFTCHFYSVLKPIKGLTDGTEAPLPSGIFDSFTWATDKNVVEPITGRANREGWKHARDYQFVALTDATKSAREDNMAHMLYALGHVIHLNQDLSQPDHVRNDAHASTRYIEKYGKEIYLKKPKSIAFQTQARGWISWRNAGFTKLKDFWDRGLYTGNASELNNEGGANLGLAEFSNGNFVGEDALYTEVVAARHWEVYADHSFPFPKLETSTNFREVKNNINEGAEEILLADGQTGTRKYVKKTGDGIIVEHHSALTYIGVKADPFAGTFGNYWKLPVGITINDPKVLEDLHLKMIPKAIEYSAGILDYFFRGKIDVGEIQRGSPNSTITVTNLSGQDLFGGEFKILNEAANGTRTTVATMPHTGSLAHNATKVLTFTAGTGQTNIVVYKGTIGSNNGQALDPVDNDIAIAVKNFTFPNYAWWKMEEAGTASRVDSGQGIPLHVTLGGASATASSVPGKIGNGIKLSTGYNNNTATRLRNLSAGIVANGTSVSAAGWFKMAWTTGIIGLRVNVNGSDRCDFGMDGNFSLWGNSSGDVAIPTPSYNLWTFFIMDIDSAGNVSLEFNRNGDIYSASATPISAGNLLNVDFITDFQLTVATEDLYLDEIGLFTRLLTADERNYLWNNGNGRTPPIVFP